MPSIFGVPSADWIKVVVYVLVLGVIWILMRSVMRFTTRLFLFGFGAIMALGLILFAVRAIRGY